jgi:serine/threonine-protein kinase
LQSADKKYLLTLAGVFVLIFGLAQANAQTEIVEQYNRAIGLPTNERIVLLTEVIEKAPNFLEARYALGAAYYDIGNFSAAVPQFEYILARPEETAQKPALSNIIEKSSFKELVATAYNAIGNEFIEAAKPDSAIIVLKKAIHLDEKKTIYHYNLGIAYLKKANYRLALKSLRESLRLDQNNTLAWFNLGTAYWYLDDFENAINAYKKGLVLEPNNQSAIANLKKAEGKIRIEMLFSSVDSALVANNPDFAITLLNQIKSLDPANPHVEDKLQQSQHASNYKNALKLYRAGRLSESLQIFKTVPAGYKESEKFKIALRQKILSAQIDSALFVNSQNTAGQTDIAGKSKTGNKQKQGLTKTSRVDSGKDVSSSSAAIDTNLNVESEITALLAQEPEQAKGDSSFQRFLIFLFTGSILVFAMFLLFRQARRRNKQIAKNKKQKKRKAETGSEQDEESVASVFVKAAVEKIDFNQLEKDLASSESESSNQKFFERLIDDKVIVDDSLSDSGSVEIHEIVDNEKDNEKTSSEPDKSLKDSFADAIDPDRDDFLSIIHDESAVARKLIRDESTTDSGEIGGGDATHTVDMSQFKTRKIGRYIIEKEIGRGAAGRIYKAWDPKLDRTVVIKTVSYSLTASDDEIRRLKARVYREARAAAKLNHPNIVVVYDVEDEPTFSYIVMEYIEGPDLREMLLQENKISPPRSLNILMQVCKALHFSHSSGIIHRDIKPSNILIIEKDKVKVTDFGIAKVSNHMTLTQTGRVVGTPSYMAPEQIEGADVDGRADIFSLGIVFYELLTGQRPFVGESLAALAYKIVHVEPTPPSLINLELSDTYDEIVSRAIAKDPADRFQSIPDFMSDLQRVQSQLASSK